MSTNKTTRAAVKALCAMFVERAKAQLLKGKKRDLAAIEYIIGAAAFAHCVGDKAAYNQLTILAMLVCTARSAFAKVEECASEELAETHQEIPPNKVPLVVPDAPAIQFDVHTVIAISTKRGAFGIGANMVEAARNLRRESPMANADVLRFYSCPRGDLKITTGADLQIAAPLGSYCGRLEV